MPREMQRFIRLLEVTRTDLISLKLWHSRLHYGGNLLQMEFALMSMSERWMMKQRLTILCVVQVIAYQCSTSASSNWPATAELESTSIPSERHAEAKAIFYYNTHTHSKKKAADPNSLSPKQLHHHPKPPVYNTMHCVSTSVAMGSWTH